MLGARQKRNPAVPCILRSSEHDLSKRLLCAYFDASSLPVINRFSVHTSKLRVYPSKGLLYDFGMARPGIESITDALTLRCRLSGTKCSNDAKHRLVRVLIH